MRLLLSFHSRVCWVFLPALEMQHAYNISQALAAKRRLRPGNPNPDLRLTVISEFAESPNMPPPAQNLGLGSVRFSSQLFGHPFSYGVCSQSQIAVSFIWRTSDLRDSGQRCDSWRIQSSGFLTTLPVFSLLRQATKSSVETFSPASNCILSSTPFQVLKRPGVAGRTNRNVSRILLSYFSHSVPVHTTQVCS